MGATASVRVVHVTNEAPGILNLERGYFNSDKVSDCYRFVTERELRMWFQEKTSASLIPDGFFQAVPGKAGAPAAEAAPEERTRGDT